MIRQIEERVDFCHGHSLSFLALLYDFVPGPYFSFPQDAEIESWTSARCEQCRHARLVHANTDAIASNARLCDFEQCGADLKTVPNAHGGVWQSFHREV